MRIIKALITAIFGWLLMSSFSFAMDNMFEISKNFDDKKNITFDSLCNELNLYYNEKDYESAHNKYLEIIKVKSKCYEGMSDYHSNESYVTHKDIFSIMSPDALFAVGHMYYDGLGVDEDIKKATIFLKEARKKGTIDTEKKLMFLYFNDQKYEKALILFHSLLENHEIIILNEKQIDGLIEAINQLNIENMHNKSLYALARFYLKGLSIDENNKINLDLKSERKTVFEKDEKKAIDIFIKAGQSECVDSMSILADYYYQNHEYIESADYAYKIIEFSKKNGDELEIDKLRLNAQEILDLIDDPPENELYDNDDIDYSFELECKDQKNTENIDYFSDSDMPNNFAEFNSSFAEIYHEQKNSKRAQQQPNKEFNRSSPEINNEYELIKKPARCSSAPQFRSPNNN